MNLQSEVSYLNGIHQHTVTFSRVFPRPFTHWGGGGGICPPSIWGDKVLMGGTHKGDIDLMGGDLTLIEYFIN